MERTMSEQEMQFADPDWKPGHATTPTYQVSAQPVNPSRAARPVNPVNADEWEYKGYAGVTYPERDEQPQPQRGYLQPQPRRRRSSPPWLVIGIIVFALIFVLGLAQGYQPTRVIFNGPNLSQGMSFAKPQRGFPFQDSQQFKLGDFPTLNVVNLTGSITVVTGDTPPGVVMVQPEQSNGFFGGNGPVPNSAMQTAQSGDGSTLNVNVNANSSDAVDVTIYVPQDITLNLQTQDGDISVSNVTGQMTLKSNDGDIELDGDTLQQHSSIQTDSGDINFSGAIDSQGTYQLISNSGDITVGLDGGTSYHLHAISQSGDFNGNGAASSFSSGDGNGVNIQENVGSNPQASLTLQTQSGDIDLTS
jgi:hypothetical protein